MWNRIFASLALASALLVSLGTAHAHPPDRGYSMCVSLGGHFVQDGSWLIGKFESGVVTITDVRTGKMITIDEDGAIYGIGSSGRSFIIQPSKVSKMLTYRRLRNVFSAVVDDINFERVLQTHRRPLGELTILSSCP